MQIFPLIDPYALHQDGKDDLTGDWVISTKSITLTAGTLTAEQITSTDDITAAGTVQAEHLYTTDDLEVADSIVMTKPTATDIVIGGRGAAYLTVQATTSGIPLGQEFYTADGDGTDDNYFQLFGVGTPTQQANRELLGLGFVAAGIAPYLPGFYIY